MHAKFLAVLLPTLLFSLRVVLGFFKRGSKSTVGNGNDISDAEVCRTSVEAAIMSLDTTTTLISDLLRGVPCGVMQTCANLVQQLLLDSEAFKSIETLKMIVVGGLVVFRFERDIGLDARAELIKAVLSLSIAA